MPHSEFPQPLQVLRQCLNLTWLKQPHNLSKHIDVPITMHALILSKSGERKQICGEPVFFQCNSRENLDSVVNITLNWFFEGQQRQRPGGIWAPRPTYTPGFSLFSGWTCGFCLGLPGMRAALGRQSGQQYCALEG